MKKIIVFLLILSASLCAGDIKGTVSSGIYTGTPFWNAENYQDGNVIDPEASFMRTVNQLQVRGRYDNGFSFAVKALRSDDFESENHLSETKIYQAYARYNFTQGMVRAGRFSPFNRWIHSAIDGGAIGYSITPSIKINVMGGQTVRYGKVYDSDNSQTVVYGDVSMKLKNLGFKLKFLSHEDYDRAGLDFHGRLSCLRYSGNYGYDLTEERIADGGLNLFYMTGKNLALSASYRLFRLDDWKMFNLKLNGYYIERLSAGARYKISRSYSIDFKQMVAMTEEAQNYLTTLTFTGSFFYAGLNYLSGDSGNERLGFTLGGKYEPLDGLVLSAGISPVDYMFAAQDEHELMIATYFKAAYQALSNLSVTGYLNYYNDNDALHASTRGGVRLTYNFGS